MEVSGLDSDGRQFKNAEEMWREKVGDPNKKTEWYRQGVGYWEVSITSFLSFQFRLSKPVNWNQIPLHKYLIFVVCLFVCWVLWCERRV